MFAVPLQELCAELGEFPEDCVKEALWVIANSCQSLDVQIVDVRLLAPFGYGDAI